MMYNTGISTLPLTQRKQALEELVNEMCKYYVLTRQDIIKYNVWLFAPDKLQVDILIHLLDIYTKELDLSIIDTILAENKELVNQYKSGNAKAINSILGKILTVDKSINPKDCMSYLKEHL